MKKLFLILLGLLAETEIEAALPPPQLNYYIGLGGHVRQVQLHKRFGQPLLNLPLHQVGLFGGLMINDCFGFEIGYDHSFNNSVYKIIGNGQYFPGSKKFISYGHTETYEVSHYINGINFGFIAYLPIYETSTNLFFTGGTSYTDVNSRFSIIENDPNKIPKHLTPNGVLTFSNERFIPYLKAGVQYSITENTMIRIHYDWKNIKQFSIKSEQYPHSESQLKYKNSFGYGMGLLYAW